MVYLIDPAITNRPPCKTYCSTDCSTKCGIKPLYGIDPIEI